MSTGQTFLTIGAMMLLSVILISGYRLLASGSQTVTDSQAAITETAILTSIQEVAQGLPYDEKSIDSFITTTNIASLTEPAKLGPDNPPPSGEHTEDSLGHFDDFDDLNNYQYDDTSFAASTGKFRLKLSVSYVNPANLSQISASRTFVKRLDMKIWRFFPTMSDTLRSSCILGYFHFD